MRMLLCLALSMSTAASAAPAKPTVAVLNFDFGNTNRKDEDVAALAKGFPAMVLSDLTGLSQIRIVERIRMQEVLDELKLSQTSKIDPASSQKLGKLLGADFLVFGSYFLLGETMNVTTRVVDVETGETITVPGATGKSDDFMSLEQKLVGSLRSALAEKVPAFKAAAGDAAPKKTPAKLAMKGAVAYSKALDDIDHHRPEDAKKKLQEVVKQNPDFELAALDLATLMK